MLDHELDMKPKMGTALLKSALTKQVLQYSLVLVPEAVEGVPARTPVGQRVSSNPASTGELIKVLTGAHPTVQGLQDFSSHSDAGFCEAGVMGWVCGRRQVGGETVSQEGRRKPLGKEMRPGSWQS